MRHFVYFIIIAFFLCLLSACQSQERKPKLEKLEAVASNFSNPLFYLGGIHINESDAERWANTLDEVGMNTVEITVYAKQWYWNTDDLTFDLDESIPKEIQEIKAAKAKGLKVVLILRVQLQHWFKENNFLWHGMIMPKDEQTLGSWFKRYTAFTLLWAKICEQEGVDVFAIGSELNSLTSTMPLTSMPFLYSYYNSDWSMYWNERRILKYKEVLQDKNLWISGYDIGSKGENWLEQYVKDRMNAFDRWSEQVTFEAESNSLEKMNQRRKMVKDCWVNLIRKVRQIYSGKVTYAANYDNYHEVNFWEYLDFIGINAYFPLRNPTEKLPPTEELLAQFEENWRNVFQQINAFKKKQHLSEKPLLFTELGYTNFVNSTVESWSGSGFILLRSGLNERLVTWDEEEVCGEERYLAVEALRRVTEKYNTNLQGILYWKLTTIEYLLREEPFALHIQKPSKDPLQDALVKFLTKEPKTE